MHEEIYQTLKAVAAQAACAVHPWWLWTGHASAPMPPENKPKWSSHASNAGIQAGQSAEHSTCFSCSPQLSCQLQGLAPFCSSESARIQTIFSTLHRGELSKSAFSGLRCCIFLFPSILHFVTAPFTNVSSWRKHPRATKSHPKFKLRQHSLYS